MVFNSMNYIESEILSKFIKVTRVWPPLIVRSFFINKLMEQNYVKFAFIVWVICFKTSSYPYKVAAWIITQIIQITDFITWNKG